MERLTERLENGAINVKYASQHETAIHRLASIEDILGDEYDLDELREMVQAKRDGRCVVLPAGIGDTVHHKKEHGGPYYMPFDTAAETVMDLAKSLEDAETWPGEEARP